MDELIEAFKIFAKYLDKDSYGFKYPTNCTVHDQLLVTAIDDKNLISEKDNERLEELSFTWNEEFDCYSSSKFGSS